MLKTPYELISPRHNRKDCRKRLFEGYQDFFKLPYENVFFNEDDFRSDDLWEEIEKVKIKIKNNFYSLKQKIDNSIWLEEVKEHDK